MRKLSFVVALLYVLTVGGPAFAWGDEGHKVVCEIAFSEVKPSTYAAIIELIRADGEFDTFSDSCTWAAGR
jgi:nuclease S1